ncbi:MAG: DUF433 domain-containing protein [Propionibacteriaceae bacterium]|jgi:uncharacterized protein (DUF433 family)/DNA-binding transcriptional MerR regulator|nr:DUF433 domain-containing protein [Propionibacteriaceae bacterium]
MSFPIGVTSVLSGASISQLHRWRRTDLLVPEINAKRPPLYSFRDVVALRTVVRLRANTSLQKIRQAFGRLPEYDLTEHVSSYMFAVRGSSIAVQTDEGWLDLVKNPGNFELYTLADIYAPFVTKQGTQVEDFRHPRPHLEVDARRAGGWPVLENTRIGYDVIASAVDNKTLHPEQVSRFYPGVSTAAARDAISFDSEVRQRIGKAA